LIKERIGVQLQSSAYYNFLTLREILELFGGFYNKSIPPKELLSLVHLEEKENSLVVSLSGGQRQRFSIVASLVNDPEIVFLDEPTTGLDPLARRNLWDLIAKIKSQGKTIILTTHYMEEAEVLCDRIAIMDQGKILEMGRTHKLVGRTKNPFKMSFGVANPEARILDQVGKLGELKNLAGKSGFYEARFDSQERLNQALSLVQKLNPESLTVGKASLEDLFIELTGKRIGEDNA
jgi:ABC-2 type transport system ATP-binding protein